jgi:hypothetical protein
MALHEFNRGYDFENGTLSRRMTLQQAMVDFLFPQEAEVE